MIGNIIVLLVIAAILTGAIAKIISDKKKGIRCSGCSCGSDDCPAKSSCCD